MRRLHQRRDRRRRRDAVVGMQVREGASDDLLARQAEARAIGVVGKRHSLLEIEAEMRSCCDSTRPR